MLIDDVNGTRLNVLDEGEGHALLLLHGIGGSWREWQRQLDALSDRYRCIVVDHRLVHGTRLAAGRCQSLRPATGRRRRRGPGR